MNMYEEIFRNSILSLKDKLYRMALRITENTAEAEDVVQDTMLRMWERREEWEQWHLLEAMVMTTCRNLALDRQRLKSNENIELVEDEVQAKEKDIHEAYVAREGVAQVESIVKRLPAKQRDVFNLREIEGMSYKEIEDILQLSEEQVKVYLFRARQYIKKHWLD